MVCALYNPKDIRLRLQGFSDARASFLLGISKILKLRRDRAGENNVIWGSHRTHWGINHQPNFGIGPVVLLTNSLIFYTLLLKRDFSPRAEPSQLFNF